MLLRQHRRHVERRRAEAQVSLGDSVDAVVLFFVVGSVEEFDT